MFGFLKKLFGFGPTETKPVEQVGFVAQEVVQVIPEAIRVDDTPLVVLGPEVKPTKVRPEVAASSPAAWPFPTKKPVEGKKPTSGGKQKGKKPAPKKKPANAVTPEPAKKPAAPAKKKPAARTPAKKKTK